MYEVTPNGDETIQLRELAIVSTSTLYRYGLYFVLLYHEFYARTGIG